MANNVTIIVVVVNCRDYHLRSQIVEVYLTIPSSQKLFPDRHCQQWKMEIVTPEEIF